jgi:hypothetical protein
LIIFLAVAVTLGWVLPIKLGLKAARRNGYSPMWMLFGIHPLGGWIAYILLAHPNPRFPCPHCKEFMRSDATVCPHCRREVAQPQADQAPQPPAETRTEDASADPAREQGEDRT